MTTVQKIQEMHATYCGLTGLSVSIIQREHVWGEWVVRGLTNDDLKLWITELKRRIAAGKPDSLRFMNAIENVSRAEENIVELRRKQRGYRAPTNRESVLRSTGRGVENPSPEKPLAEIVGKITANPEAAEKAFRELQELKRSL